MKKVLIVGAGPSGLSLAVELAKNGIIAKVIEKRNGISNLSRAVGILPKTLCRFKTIGIEQAISKEAVHITKACIFNNDKLALEMDITCADVLGYNYMTSLPQDRTEAILEQRFEELGGKVEYVIELENIELAEDGKSAIAIYKNGKKESFDYIAGADGSRSKVAESVDIKKHGYELPETWHIADFYTKQQDNIDAATISKHGEKMLFMVRMAKARYRVVSNTDIDLLKLSYNLDVESVYREGSFKIQVKQAETYVKDCVALCGDAAHTHSPAGGRGMNLGIDDAFELAKAIINDDLATYNKQQHAQGDKIVKETERLLNTMTTKGFIKENIFKIALFFVSKVPVIQKKVATKLLTF